MGKTGISAEEKAWLDTYDINQYDRPSVAADMAVFSIMGLASHTEGNGSGRTGSLSEPLPFTVTGRTRRKG